MKYLKTAKNYFAGSHQLRLLLGTLIVLVVADGLISKFLVTQRFGIEGNPLLRTWVGEDHFLVIKLLGVLLAALILWDIHKRHPKLAFMSTLFFVTSYTLILYWNLFAFLTALTSFL